MVPAAAKVLEYTFEDDYEDGDTHLCHAPWIFEEVSRFLFPFSCLQGHSYVYTRCHGNPGYTIHYMQYAEKLWKRVMDMQPAG